MSPESSPTGSVADEESRRTSPSSTWGSESPVEAREGAVGYEQEEERGRR